MVAVYQYMRLRGYPADKISILTTYNGQRALISDVIESRCARHPAFGRPLKVRTSPRLHPPLDARKLSRLTSPTRMPTCASCLLQAHQSVRAVLQLPSVSSASCLFRAHEWNACAFDTTVSLGFIILVMTAALAFLASVGAGQAALGQTTFVIQY